MYYLIVFASPLVSHFSFFSVDKDLAAFSQDTLGGTFHHKKVSALDLVDGELPFVGGVEWDFDNLWVFGTDALNVSKHHFAAFQEGGLGGITSGLTLQDWASLAGQENGTVAKGGNTAK